VSALIDLEKTNIRLSNNYFWVAQKLRYFSFDITESPTNAQTSRKNSVRSKNYLGLATLSHHRCILVDLTSTI